MRLLPPAHERGDRADGDDGPSPRGLGCHLVGDGLYREEGAVQVDVLHAAPEGVGQVEEGVERAYPGVGDEDVDSGKGGDGRGDDLARSAGCLGRI